MEKSKIQLIQSQSIALSLLDTNDGQIAGVPANPRTIDPVDFANLKKSIEDNPEMLGMRELLVYPVGGRYVVIGGNMRLKAMRDLGFSDAPCKVLPESTDTATLRAVLIKDNVQKGEWNTAMLDADWEKDKLKDWGVELPDFSGTQPQVQGVPQRTCVRGDETQPTQEIQFNNLPTELQGLNIDADKHDDIRGEDETPYKRVIITYKDDEEKAVAEMLGVDAIDRVIYKFEEL